MELLLQDLELYTKLESCLNYKGVQAGEKMGSKVTLALR